jgi:exosortase A
MVSVWLESETFTHGFLILPISLWLVWRDREKLRTVSVRPKPSVLSLTLLAGMAWLVADIVDVSVVKQLAFVLILVTGIWSIIGSAAARCLAFPLGFLFLAVPMGRELIPPLMEFTSDTTEFLVRASGVPVYRDGNFLSLPTGNWSVVEACSGVRYLIASFTLGLLYSHLTYRSIWRKSAFLLASVLVPIIANSLRAYGIVMIGHLSNMELATGVDHLVYGWVFFGFVILLLFWIGGYWAEDTTVAVQARQPGEPTQQASAAGQSVFFVSLLAILLAGTGPLMARSFEAGQYEQLHIEAMRTPVAAPNWSGSTSNALDWRPAQRNADREIDSYYAKSDQAVGLYLRQYLQQGDDAELVHGGSVWRPDPKVWRVAHYRSVPLKSPYLTRVAEARIIGPDTELLVWSWYRVGDRSTSNPYLAKLFEAGQRLFEGRRDGARVFIATPVGAGLEADRTVLSDFLNVHYASIVEVLDERVQLPTSPSKN